MRLIVQRTPSMVPTTTVAHVVMWVEGAARKDAFKEGVELGVIGRDELPIALEEAAHMHRRPQAS